MNRIRNAFAVTLLAVTGVLTATLTPASAATYGSYIALGDSFAAGPLIPNQVSIGCARSDHNYPHLLALRLGIATLTDVTCSGAKSTHMTERQHLSLGDVDLGYAAPQFDALRADTALVTLTIGGNDVGLIGVANDCDTYDPFDDPCKNKYIVDGVDQIDARIDAFAPKLGVVLDQIRQRSPSARIVLVGYGLYIKQNGCWPLQPVLATDANWLQAKVNYLNKAMVTQAAARGASYVDLVGPSYGHDACRSPSARWIEGYVPLDLAAPLHPNGRGESNYAAIIAGAIG